jgi:serine/threonine protein kinase
VLPDGRLRETDSIRLAQGLLRALRAMNAAEVTHRDIKPSNIILASHGPVVVDFEISHHPDDDRITSQGGGQSGTPRYMSPEQFDGSSLSPAIDLFGWGVTVAEAVTGHHPFAPHERVADWPVVNRSGKPSLAGAPARLIPLLHTVLSPDPARRSTVGYLEKHLSGDEMDVPTASHSAVPLLPEPPRGPDVEALAGEVIKQAQEWVNQVGRFPGNARGVVAGFEDRITDGSGWFLLACVVAAVLGLLTATVLRVVVTVMSG